MVVSARSCDRLVLELRDEAATAALARRLAGHLGRGDVIALAGDLGSGKTCFARALINALPWPGGARRDEEVPSPTFTLVQIYEREPAPVWHFDLYRLERPEEVYELGLEEALGQAVSVIEWPERLGPLLPVERLELTFRFVRDPGARRVEIAGLGAAAARLEDRLRDA